MKIIGSNPLSDFLIDQKAIQKSIQKVLFSGKYILGDEVSKFEKEFANYVGTKYSVGVANGTEALHLALRSLDIGEGDEVITSTHTAVATVTAIVLTGAKPVLVDIEENFFTIDPLKIKKSITSRTKAIIPVHLYGQPAAMDKIMIIAKMNNLFIIEDCSQSHGAKYNKIKTGNFGHIGCFSFYPTKNLGSLGDAGAIVTNNKNLKNKILLLREYGWQKKFNSKTFGTNSRLDEIQAAILRIKLKKLDKFNKNRIKIANNYHKDLSELDILLPKTRTNNNHVFHLFVIRSKYRNFIKSELEKKKIYTSIQYPIPIHKQKFYKNLDTESLIVSEKISKEILSLPIYPSLKKNEYKYIIKSLYEIMNK